MSEHIQVAVPAENVVRIERRAPAECLAQTARSIARLNELDPHMSWLFRRASDEVSS